MKISVITASYNRRSTIEGAILSVLSQDWPNVEYVVVDGASTDGTQAVIEKYADRIGKYISEPDKGMYQAINKGIGLATGDVIGLVHSDDEFYSPDVLSRVAAKFMQEELDILYADGIFVDEGNTAKVVRNWISGKYSKKRVKRGWLPLHPTVYVRREVFQKAGLYDESYRIAADSDWLVRILYDHDFRVGYLEAYTIRMRMGGASTSAKTQIKKWKEDLRMYRSHGFCAGWSLTLKILSKVKQFIPQKDAGSQQI